MRVAGAILGVSALSALVGSARRHEAEETRVAARGSNPEAGTSSLGRDALMRRVDVSYSGWDPEAVIARKLPREPLEGQRRPPCTPRTEEEINGGCWVLVGKMKPPCGEHTFEHEGGCYMPSARLPKRPVSGEKGEQR